jgi:hypothetical protein
MKLSRIVALAAAALLIPLLAACGGSASGSSESSATGDATIGAQPTGGDPLAGTSWVLTGGLSKDVSASGITIEFAEKDVSGKSGVNTYFGGYTSTVKSRDIVNPCPGTSFMPGVSSSCGRRVVGGLWRVRVCGRVAGSRVWGRGRGRGGSRRSGRG